MSKNELKKVYTVMYQTRESRKNDEKKWFVWGNPSNREIATLEEAEQIYSQAKVRLDSDAKRVKSCKETIKTQTAGAIGVSTIISSGEQPFDMVRLALKSRYVSKWELETIEF